MSGSMLEIEPATEVNKKWKVIKANLKYDNISRK
jgi:hypothetical protein